MRGSLVALSGPATEVAATLAFEPKRTSCPRFNICGRYYAALVIIANLRTELRQRLLALKKFPFLHWSRDREAARRVAALLLRVARRRS